MQGRCKKNMVLLSEAYFYLILSPSFLPAYCNHHEGFMVVMCGTEH